MRSLTATRRNPRLLLLLFTLPFIMAGCTEKPGRLEITVADGPNPWTQLNLHNSPDNFQFAIVSDRNGGRRPGIFGSAVEKLNLLQPEFVMCVGDLIGGYTEDIESLDMQWDQFEQRVGRLEMPFFYLVGNHDVTNEVQITKWEERFGRLYYHFIYRDVLFLCLNSEDPPQRHEADSIGDEQYDYFRRILAENVGARWTMIFIHKPMWNREERSEGWDRFENLLDGRDYTVFAGHVHKYLKSVRKGHNYYQLSLTGGGSELKGVEEREFDHIMWVTMTDEGPRLVNLLLDGILDDDLGR